MQRLLRCRHTAVLWCSHHRELAVEHCPIGENFVVALSFNTKTKDCQTLDFFFGETGLAPVKYLVLQGKKFRPELATNLS